MSDLVVKKQSNLSASFKASEGIGPSNDFGQEDFSVPWLAIAQRTTKKATKGSPDYIPGLETGMFFNSINGKVYGEKLKVCVIKFMRTYTEVSDDDDQKYIGPLTADQYKNNLSQAGGDFKKARTPAGNLQKEQFNYFVVLPDHLDDGILRMGISPGGFGACKAWNVALAGFKPGYTYAGVWELTLMYNDGDYPFFTIGVGSKPSAVRVDVVSGELQHFCEAATLSLHENLSKLSDNETPF